METILKIICSVILLSDGSQNISHYKLYYQQGYFCSDEITRAQQVILTGVVMKSHLRKQKKTR